MLSFLREFVLWLSTQDIIPREVVDTDTGDARENKTYLMGLPEEVTNVFCIRQYNQRLPSLTGKEAGVRYIQLIVRNTSHEEVITKIEKAFNFLKNRPTIIEDLPNYWVIIDCNEGPRKMEEDSQGNYLYSLSFAITTKA